MINRPVIYDKQEMSIIDAKRVVICHPFRKVGLPDNEFHKLGVELAGYINGNADFTAFAPAHAPTALSSPVPPLETKGQAVPEPSKEIAKPKRGRPKGKK